MMKNGFQPSLSVVITLGVLIGGGLITWGETRFTVAAQGREIIKLEEKQDDTDKAVDVLREQQGRIDERLKGIQDEQKEQKNLLNSIFRAVAPPPAPRR